MVELVDTLVACVDFGSTFTKAALVDVSDGALRATADHPTTLGTDLWDGWEACRADLARVDARARDAPVLACSSAGGGLRIAVVGNEELVTAEAGRRVALSSGGRVVHVAAGGLDTAAVGRLRSASPDVVLLVGGTDGGNGEVLTAAAAALARERWSGPVVVAGNVDAQAEVATRLADAGTPYRLAGNVLPRIGELAPGQARAAVRETFLAHVIGGKGLSARADFTRAVRGATPDLVLAGVELLARGPGAGDPGEAECRGVGDVVVVDVGGATTDVHSVVEPDPEQAGLSREVVATGAVTRTVEADLGMRWSAVSTLEEGRAAGLVGEQQYAALLPAAHARRADPAYLPDSRDDHASQANRVNQANHADDADLRAEERIAAVAVGLALRRHAGRSQVVFGPDGRVVERTGRDLREVGLLVGSGGVLRHRPAVAQRVLARATDAQGRAEWQLPRAPRVAVDRCYVLAAAGLLAAEHPQAAYRLVRSVW